MKEKPKYTGWSGKNTFVKEFYYARNIEKMFLLLNVLVFAVYFYAFNDIGVLLYALLISNILPWVKNVVRPFNPYKGNAIVNLDIKDLGEKEKSILEYFRSSKNRTDIRNICLIFLLIHVLFIVISNVLNGNYNFVFFKTKMNILVLFAPFVSAFGLDNYLMWFGIKKAWKGSKNYQQDE